MARRLLDIAVSAVTLCVLAPLGVVIAMLIRISSPGPVLHRAVRVGRHGVPFVLYKFRSMHHGAERLGPGVTAADDPRITGIGRWLRRFKVDELPQFWNVLRGEMALVGPRPEDPRYVALYTADQREVLGVRPGLTGAASLLFRNEAGLLDGASVEDAYVSRLLPQKLRIDLAYLRSRTLRSDLDIIWRTAVALASGGSSRQDAASPDHAPRRGPRRLRLSSRPVVVMVFHLGLAWGANYAAFWLRFDGAVPATYWSTWIPFTLLLIALRGAAFLAFRVHRTVWRYTSVTDLRSIIGAVTTSSLVFFVLVRGVLGVEAYPRSVYVMDAVLLIVLAGGVRLAKRLVFVSERTPPGRRVLVVGAGDLGEAIVRDMIEHSRPGSYLPVGFVDDDRGAVGKRIRGVPIVGTSRELPALVDRFGAEEILIALPPGQAPLVREIVQRLEPLKIPIKTLPSLSDIIHGHVSVSTIRTLSIEDLLPRPAIGLDSAALRSLIEGRRVLVTGAGGSIGSELCRQVARFAPASLVLLERYENSLFAISNELIDRDPAAPLVAVIADVTDARRLEVVFAEHRPEIVFHAAAHKHVPLMELNPCEAVKNNVTGTRLVAETARRWNVDRFVLISTDKAVNPTNVMGATKRVAEMVVQGMARRTATRFVAVRFGNVLGSNGSVVPRFLDQIRAGGPVTVTHPEIRRYFMLIPEAVQLVLHAAAMAQGGEVFVLEMGEQIAIADMARNLIRLSGFVPDEEIQIVYTGLRPGEKLFEELVGQREIVDPSDHDKIHRVRPGTLPDPARLRENLGALIRSANDGNRADVLRWLQAIVPTYEPSTAGPQPVPSAAPAPRWSDKADDERSWVA